MRRQLLLAALVCAAGSAAALGEGIRTADLVPLRWIVQAVPEALPKLKYPGYAEALDKAHMEIQSGRYRLALQTLQLADGVDPARRTLMIGEALLRSGRYAEAIETLSRPEVANNSTAKAMYASALAESGKRRDAAALLQTAIQADPANPLLRWHHARILRSMGQIEQEKAALQWFAQQQYQQAWQKDDLASIDSPDTLIAIGEALDRLAVLTGEYRENRPLHQNILNMFIRAYDELDRQNVDAHVAAARFFFAHGDAGKAKQELDTALDANPNHIDALYLLGTASLQHQNGAQAAKAANTLRGVNPEMPQIRRLDAGLLILEKNHAEALRVLTQAQQSDPDSAELMAMLAGCDALSPNPEDLPKRLAQADALMPQESIAHIAAARTMVMILQAGRAIPLLEQAITRTPHWNIPRNILGTVYMLGTDTSKARPVLQAAYDLDPFSVETTNYLRLLDSLDSFETRTGAHFTVRFNPATDPFLADEILSYMEANYPRISAHYKHELPQPTFIELAADLEDFSVRVSGRPWHANFGVSQGPVITLITPRAGKTMGPFDWCDVLRHEFVHTVTLDMTQGRIPRWFTEGLAVSEQITPLWSTRYRLLARAGARDAFLPVNRLDQAIVTGADPELGYSQGHWICQYITEKRGHPTILAMLQSYRDGLTTDAVFGKHLGMSVREFDKEFSKWGKEKLKSLGLDPQSQRELTAIAKEGNELIKAKDYPAAMAHWEKALARYPVDLQVHQRLAGLYLHKEINQPEKAIPHLRALDKEQLKDNRYAIRLSKLYTQLNRPDDALASARRACQIRPYDPDARQNLIRALTAANQPDEAAKQQQIIAWLEKSTPKPAATPAE